MMNDLGKIYGISADDDTLDRMGEHLDNPRSDVRLFLEQMAARARGVMKGDPDIPTDSWEVATALAEREAAGRPVNQQRIEEIHFEMYGVRSATHEHEVKTL